MLQLHLSIESEGDANDEEGQTQSWLQSLQKSGKRNTVESRSNNFCGNEMLIKPLLSFFSFSKKDQSLSVVLHILKNQKSFFSELLKKIIS